MSNRGGRRTQAFNERVYQEYGRACYVCGTTEDIQVDHIIPYSVRPDLEFELENCRPICGLHNKEKSNKTTAIRLTWINPRWIKRDAS